MNDEKKEEFFDLYFYETSKDKLWVWIENALKQARIEENKTYSQLIDEGYGYNGGIQNIVFKNRIKELEKE